MGNGQTVAANNKSSYRTKKCPHPVDIHVGKRVRLCRIRMGLSQEKLGDSVGSSYQQIQKYEKGVNRISASCLFKLSQLLDVPVQFFFEGLSSVGSSADLGISELDTEAFLYKILNTSDALELTQAIIKIEDSKVRRSVIDLVRSLGRCPLKSIT